MSLFLEVCRWFAIIFGSIAVVAIVVGIGHIIISPIWYAAGWWTIPILVVIAMTFIGIGEL